jgi:hypothetical protein
MNKQLFQISSKACSRQNYAKKYEQASALDLQQNPQQKTMLKIMNRQLLKISSKACIIQNYANTYELAIAPDLQQNPQQTTS